MIGKVVGSVISTRKNENLVGNKFLIIEPIKSMAHAGDRMVAIDNVGAGIGEVVRVASGCGARMGWGMEGGPIDAAIVGISDEGVKL